VQCQGRQLFFPFLTVVARPFRSLLGRLSSSWLDLGPPLVETELPPQGPEGVEHLGHRTYVGGLWDQMGEHQFRFLLQRGLRPQDVLLDIACGSLRLGVKVIPYLEPGHYLGVEKEGLLLQRGVEQELGTELVERYRPRLLQNAAFAFELLATPVDVALAQSLFTHLTPEAIGRCLRQLRPWLKPSGVFYATFFESHRSQRRRLRQSHDHASFLYTRAEIEAFGEREGYTVEYIGNWGHPRHQVMVAYRLPPALAGFNAPSGAASVAQAF